MNEAEPGLADLLSATAREIHVEPPDLASPFLDRLVSLSLEELVQQPVDIANELSAVQSELVNLCFREYSTFISVHKCSAAVQSAFNDFDTSLTKLIECGPDLENASRSFSRETSSIQDTRSSINLVRDHQDKLMDLLGIPQLMDTCVRNGFYQEAIELAAQMEALRERYAAIPIVQAVVKESEQVLQAMLAQLLQLFKEPVKLPSLMKAVGFLRRLGYLEETDLAFVFLASRSLFLQSQFQQLERDRSQPVRYLRRYIDVFREHVYDIISQFSTIFDASDLIIAFANQCVDDLVSLVRSTITIIGNDSASLSSILVQLAYCGTSFARVGFDFSPLIIQPFLLAVSASFTQLLEASTAELSAFLKSASRNATIPSALLSPGVVSVSKVSDFPPVALFANGHYTALNSLRLLAPTELFLQLVQLQTNHLAEATTAVFNYIQEVERSLQDGDAPSTPSPRAHLLRRSTETQWTPAMRASRRKDTIQIFVALADVWCKQLLPSLSLGLCSGIFGGDSPPNPRLGEQIRLLTAWSDQHRERPTANGPDVGESGAELLPQDAPASPTLDEGSDEMRVNGSKPPLEPPIEVPEQSVAVEVEHQSVMEDGNAQSNLDTSIVGLAALSRNQSDVETRPDTVINGPEHPETPPSAEVPLESVPEAKSGTSTSKTRRVETSTAADATTHIDPSSHPASTPSSSSETPVGENPEDTLISSLANVQQSEGGSVEQPESQLATSNEMPEEAKAQTKKKKKRKGNR